MAGWCKEFIESDAKMIIDAFSFSNPSELLHWECINYVEKILALKSDFSMYYFVWIPTNVNKVAHLICRWAKDSNWAGFSPFELLPNKISNVMFDDVA